MTTKFTRALAIGGMIGACGSAAVIARPRMANAQAVPLPINPFESVPRQIEGARGAASVSSAPSHLSSTPQAPQHIDSPGHDDATHHEDAGEHTSLFSGGPLVFAGAGSEHLSLAGVGGRVRIGREGGWLAEIYAAPTMRLIMPESSGAEGAEAGHAPSRFNLEGEARLTTPRVFGHHASLTGSIGRGNATPRTDFFGALAVNWHPTHPLTLSVYNELGTDAGLMYWLIGPSAIFENRWLTVSAVPTYANVWGHGGFALLATAEVTIAGGFSAFAKFFMLNLPPHMIFRGEEFYAGTGGLSYRFGL